jgi:hypothetical protein
MYVRRRQRDTYKTCKTFFSNAIQIINKYTDLQILAFRFYRGDYYIAIEEEENEKGEKQPKWEQCGMATPLSEEEELKSSVFSEYYTVVYDEFISKDANKYLGTRDNPDAEWNALTSLYQTIDRGVDTPFRNETRLILLGNKSTLYNPIMLSLGMCDYVTEGAHFVAPKNRPWVWEDVGGVEATGDFEDAYAYQIASEQVQRYAYHNEGADSKFFLRRPNVAQCKLNVKLRGVEYGIYMDVDLNFYIAKPKEGYYTVALDNASHDGNDLYLISAWRDSPQLMCVSRAYKEGRLFFDTGKTQAAFLKYLQFIP